MSIHSTAVVEAGARIGDGVEIGPFCHIQAGAQIGDGCILDSRVTVLAHTTLGCRCRVHAGAVLGGEPQDTGFKGGISYVRIGDDCVLREGVTVNRGTLPGSATVIGNHCMLMACSHCGHNVQIGAHVTIANCTALAGYVTVGDRAFISGTVGVHQFVRIGTMAMLGVSAVLTKDVPPYCTVRPSTENGVGGLNIVGMRRGGLATAERAAVKTAFKVLYRSGLNVHQALAVLEQDAVESPSVLEMIRFIRGSERGICACTIRPRAAKAPSSDDDGHVEPSAGNGAGAMGRAWDRERYECENRV